MRAQCQGQQLLVGVAVAWPVRSPMRPLDRVVVCCLQSLLGAEHATKLCAG
jgi:hypothetical protein